MRRLAPLRNHIPPVEDRSRVALAMVLLTQRSENKCEFIDNGLRCSQRARHPHHRKRRSQGGGWELANLMHLCWQHHSWVHHHPEESYRRGWLAHRWEEP